MAQTGYTPILIYSSSTAAQAPAVANLTNSTLGSELAINITDGKLFYKDNANAVQVIAWKTTPTTAGGTGLTSYTAGDLLYYASGTTLSKLAIGASGRWLGSSGTAPQWNAPAALTKVDDTNVTLTLGGSASTALLNAASLTLGWTGQLATSRGGTGLSSFTANGILYASSTSALATSSSFTWNGTTFAIGAAGNAFSFTSTTSSTAYNAAQFSNSGGSIYWGVDNSAGTAFNGLAYAGVIGTSSNTAFEIFTNNVVRQTWDTSGNAKIENGNLVIGTSGKGIDFSATPGTGTSELFSDYEEGTWTPTNVSGTTGFANAEGTYTKIGRAVYVRASFDITSVTTNVFIGGLPFTSMAKTFYSVIDNNFPVAVAFKRVESGSTQIQWNVNATGSFSVTVSLTAWYFA